MRAGDPWEAARAGALGAVACGSLLRPREDLHAAHPDEPLSAAVHRMWWGQIGALPVLEDGRLRGTLGEQSLLRVTATRLAERQEAHAAAEGGLQVWEDLLRGVRVRDALTPRAEIPLVSASQSLLDGLRACRERSGLPTRYIFVADDSGEGLAGMLSLRDLARYLVDLYDGTVPAACFPSAAQRSAAQAALRVVLDLSVGEVRRATKFGHEPVVVEDGIRGTQVIRAQWEGGRGYVMTIFPDGSPKGIFTRRDLLRTLSRPYVDLEAARLASWMSASVKTLCELDTLCGLLKSMGMEGYRHMPLVDDWDRLECVISMWETVWLLASAGE